MYSYKRAGVDVDKADLLTEAIKKTLNSDNIGNFAGLYSHPYIPEYYLAGCTDGVGTKVIPLIERGKLETIAQDLIAMNLNDLICVGAKPLFFLDYFATNKLDLTVTSRFVEALKVELSKYKCTLLGGETAELSDLVVPEHFDVAGFAVGIVKKENVLKSANVQEGDVIVALSSSGPHSNGFTLIRNLYNEKLLSDSEFEQMLEPTYIYVNEIIELTDKELISACANITGGGIAGNLVRSIPKELCAEIDYSLIPYSSVFKKLESIVGSDEAYKVFNMGVGMCVITNKTNVNQVLNILRPYKSFIFGEIVKNEVGSNIRIR